MSNVLRLFLCIVLFVFTGLSEITAQPIIRSKGKSFWMAFTANHCTSGCTGNNVELNITSGVNTSGYVVSPTGWSTTFSVTANTITTVTIPTNQIVWSEEVVESKGLHIVAQDSIVVNAANYKTGSSDGAVIYEENSLDTNYLVSTYQSNHGYASHFAVVASENNTTVTITPSQNTSQGSPAGVPMTVTLDTAETYMVWAAADLSGSEVRSDKPVAVFGSARCADVPASCDYCDALYEQMIATRFWGTKYPVGKLAGRSGGDFFRIMAAKNGTDIFINGSNVATLNRGQYYDVTMDNCNYINSNNCEPIAVFQYSRGRACDGTSGTDPFLIQVSPISLFSNSYFFSTSAPSLSISHHITVVTKSINTGLVQLDGSFISPGWNSCGSGWSYATLTVASGAHVLSSDSILGATVYGWSTGGASTSYGYSIGTGATPSCVTAPLPIELTSFNGYAIQDRTKLNWHTTTEKNAAYFTLQRAHESNPENFKSIGTINAKGKDGQGYRYSYVDAHPAPGMNYYRLKQVDQDGSFKYSNTISIDLENKVQFQSSIATNPVADILNLSMSIPHDGKVQVKLLNTMGEVLQTESAPFDQGPHSYMINMQDLPQGVYFVRVRFNNITRHHKVFKH